MSISGGPKTTQTGLVLLVDAANVKSFRGEPTTNEADTDFKRTIQFHSQGAYNNAGTIVSASEYGPDWKRIVISNRGTNFRIAQFPYINHPADITKTYSVEYDSQGLSGYYFRVDGYGGFGRVNVSGAGRAQITIPSGSGIGGTLALFLMNDTTGSVPVSESIYFRNYQVEQKSYATPFTPTTRGSSSAAGGGWVDLTYTGNDGILINGTRFNAGSGGSLVFDGIDDYINCGNNSILDVGNNITVNTWINPSNIVNYQAIVAKVVSDFSLGWELANSNGGQLRSTLRPSATQINLYSTTNLVLNIWQMVTMTFDNTTLSLYINGVPTGTTTTGGPVTLNSPASLWIGARVQGNYFSGSIANTTIYNRALSTVEVLENFNSQRSRFGI